MDNPQVRLCIEHLKLGGVFILVENQMIQLKINRTSLDHYLSKGYNVNVNETICVKAEDLSPSSDKKVKVNCDYCDQPTEKTFKKFLKQREFVNKDACFKCFPLKQKEVVMVKYNTDNTMKLPEIKEKSKQTSLKKYGVENPMQSEIVQKRFKETMLINHGVEYAQQSDVIREKTKESFLSNHGVSHPIYSDTIKKKANNSFRFVNGVKVSNGQFQIAEIINGSLNTNLLGFYVDILIEQDKLVIEYNGSGHDLSVKLGKISSEEFNSKETERYNALINNGYRLLIIENKKEKKLSKTRLEIIKNKIISGITDSINYLEVV